MDWSAIIALVGLSLTVIVGIMGACWAFGLFVGKLTRSIDANTSAIMEVREELKSIHERVEKLEELRP